MEEQDRSRSFVEREAAETAKSAPLQQQLQPEAANGSSGAPVAITKPEAIGVSPIN